MYKHIQRSWVGGQLDKELQGRTDLQKYFQGASVIENFLVRRQGNLAKRRGTEETVNLENLLGNDTEGNPIVPKKIRLLPVERDDDGHFLILTDNRCYTANRDGILLCNGMRVRKILPYDAYTPDGHRIVYSGKDLLASSKHRVCIKTPHGTSGYTRTWYDSLQLAYAAIKAGETIELHANLVLSAAITKTNPPSHTLDLNGYTLTDNTDAGALAGGIRFKELAPDFEMLITSSRTGARVIEQRTSGNPKVFEFYTTVNYQYTEATGRRGKVIVDGGIEWLDNSYTGWGGLIRVGTVKLLDIRSGYFHRELSCKSAWALIQSSASVVEVHGGVFEMNNGENDATATGSIFTCNWENFSGYGSGKGILRIYGGTFVNRLTTVGSGLVAEGGNNVFIYGGRFECAMGIGMMGGYFADVRAIFGGYFSSDTSSPTSTVHSYIGTGSVKNDAWPDENGFYGVKTIGDPDYRYEGFLPGDWRPYCIQVPYADYALDALNTDQSGDTVFVAHRDYEPAKIVVGENGIPSYERIIFDNRRWQRPVIDSVTMTGNGDSEGSVRTVRYAVTYVKDGDESLPSFPKSLNYHLPWSTTAVVNLSFSRGLNQEEPDYYNIYKDNGNGWGLIGTTRSGTWTGSSSAVIDTGYLWTPVPDSGATFEIAEDFENERGIGTGGLSNRICVANRGSFPSASAADCCLMLSDSMSANGILLDVEDPDVKSMRVWLDGRIYDPVTNYSYLLASNPRIKVEFYGTVVPDGAPPQTGWFTCKFKPYEWGPGLGAETWRTPYIPSHIDIDMFIGFRTGGGIYDDWVSLGARQVTLPNGDKIWVRMVGDGQQMDWFNLHRRYVDCDFTIQGVSAANGGITSRKVLSVEKIRIRFETSVYSDWTSNQQGTIRSIELYTSGSAADGSSGNFQDDYITPDMSVTPPEEQRMRHFSGPGDYPSCVGVYGEKAQRLVYASTDLNPLTFWMSRTGDLYDFTSHASLREDDAIEATIAATELPRINHIVMLKDMMLLSDGGEWKVAPTTGNTLSYKTISAVKESMIGCSRRIKPMTVGSECIFSTHYEDRLVAISYSAMSEGYDAQDLSVLSQNIFHGNPILQMAYKKNPDSIILCVLTDGSLGSLVYMREHEVIAWSRQILGGGFKAVQVGCNKATVNGTSETMLIVERGGSFRLWRIKDDVEYDTVDKAVTMDGIVEVASKGEAEEGMTVVPTGRGTFAAGWPFVARMVTVRPEPGPSETIQFELKNAKTAELRVMNASDFTVRALTAPETAPYVSQVKLAPKLDGTKVSFVAKDVMVNLSGDNSGDGRVELKSESVWPLTVLVCAVNYEIQPLNGSEG